VSARRNGVLAVIGLVLSGPVVSAQASSPAPATAPVSEGLSLEKMQSGFVLAPEVRFTEVDGHVGTLVGGSAGWLTDDTFFIGAGWYWLADGARDREMNYGGLVLDWSPLRSGRLSLSVRGLVGLGTSTLGVERQGYYPGYPGRPGAGDGHRRFSPPTTGQTLQAVTFLVGEDFFVAEPQASASFRLTPWLRLGAGVGYRFVGGADSFDSRLRGVTGTVALRAGSF